MKKTIAKFTISGESTLDEVREMIKAISKTMPEDAKMSGL